MRYILTGALIIMCGVAALAQTEQRTGGVVDASSAASVSRRDQAVNLESGTRLAAQLQSTLDVRKARVGDQVVLKTTEAIKSNGQTLVKKGARLIGHVTDVQQRDGGSRGESSVSLVFDRLEAGSLVTPISAIITSVTQPRAQAVSDDDDFLGADANARSSSSARGSQPSGSSGSGGLLGGATGAVGDVLGTTTGAVGGVVNDTTGAAGGTLERVGRTTRSIRISQSTNASAEGGSKLSLAGDNLRLEKGARFNLTLNQATSVGGNR